MRAQVPTQYGDERRGWHIDKTINAGHLISVAAIVIPVLLWAGTVETRATVTMERIAGVERQLVADREFRDRQRAEDRQALQQAMTDLQIQIRSMADKVDRIGEKVGATR